MISIVQLDPKSANDVGAHRKESPLQKSVSQQNITQKTHPASLPSSQSALSLTKPQENNVKKEVMILELIHNACLFFNIVAKNDILVLN